MSWRIIDWTLYDARLAELAATNAGLRAIAAEFGVSESSVSSRLARLGLRQPQQRQPRGRPATVPDARVIPSLAELVPLKSLGQC
jgi:hypothetical protein